jgi:ferredoxin
MSDRRPIVVDVRDAVLGAAERVVAFVAADAVLRGLGHVALACPRAPLFVECDDEKATNALVEAATRAQANVVARAPSTRVALRLRPTALAERSWREDARGEGLVLAVAGAVETPRVIVAEPHARVADVVARATPKTRAWVALWGGAAGTLVDRDARLRELDEDAARLLLVVPTAHAVARKARTPMSAWLQRARSACASCAMCTPACPVSLPVHELLRTVSITAPRAPSAARVAAAADCTSCGACDTACPQALSPARVVGALGKQLRASGVSAPPRRRRGFAILDEERAAMRLGLARYASARPDRLERL